MHIDVSFPGGKRVNASFDGVVVKTDQSRANGGDGSEPEPFSLFLASLATCAGVFVLGFCQARGVSTEGLRLVQDAQWDDATHRLVKVSIQIFPPPGFPEKYLGALRSVAEKCSVKRVITDPPTFDIVVQGTAAQAA